MLAILFGIFFGWPIIIVTMILVVIGLLRSDYRFLVSAAILVVPFSWFLSGFPLIQSPVFLLPLLPFTSAYLMYRRQEMFAWVFAVPYFLVIWLLFNVIGSTS
jgi:hypothetical protein